MRLLPGLCLVIATSPLVRAAPPLKTDLPAGAVARLGDAVVPAKGDSRPGDVHSLTFLDDKSLFVGTGAGWTSWDLEKQKARQAKPVGGPALAVARDADRLFIGSVRKLHSIEPIQSESLEPARSWDAAADGVSVLALAPGGRRLVFSDGDQKLTVLDVRIGKATGIVELASRPVAASLTANGRVLAVVTRDGAARIYGLAANGAVEPLWTKRVARADRVAAGFSPDGRLFAVSSAGRVVILESVTGRQMHALERRFGEGDVRTLVFSADSRQIAIGSYGPEPVVRVWDVATGVERGSFTGHVGEVNAVAFSPDGRTLASAGSDTSVLLWKVPVPGAASKDILTEEAWETLDALDAEGAYRAVGCLLSHPGRGVTVIRDGIRGVAGEQERVRKWISQLDHDEFRVREAARRGILKTGLRGAAALNDPDRKKLGPEGEQRVRLILEALEAQGLRIPESGLFGEPLRAVRGIRVLETIGGKDARAALEEIAKGPAESRATKEAKLALETLPEERK
jgi:WD domain, G-beta repeat